MSQAKSRHGKHRRKTMRHLLPVLIVGVLVLALVVGVLFFVLNKGQNTATGGIADNDAE